MDLRFTNLKYSNSQGGIYCGGDVGPDSKHLLNLNMLTSTGTGVPSQVYLVDVLAVYPFLDANSIFFINTNQQFECAGRFYRCH